MSPGTEFQNTPGPRTPRRSLYQYGLKLFIIACRHANVIVFGWEVESFGGKLLVPSGECYWCCNSIEGFFTRLSYMYKPVLFLQDILKHTLWIWNLSRSFGEQKGPWPFSFRTKQEVSWFKWPQGNRLTVNSNRGTLIFLFKIISFPNKLLLSGFDIDIVWQVCCFSCLLQSVLTWLREDWDLKSFFSFQRTTDYFFFTRYPNAFSGSGIG